MSQYGELIGSYDPFKDNIYKMFTLYFENPNMTKIKDINNFSMYLTKIHSLLGREYRYLIVIVNKDNFPNGRSTNLANLYWISLQTRTLIENHDVQAHSYNPRHYQPLSKEINLISKENKVYSYKCPTYPILNIILLAKKDGDNEYTQRGNIINAIETYNTIITFN